MSRDCKKELLIYPEDQALKRNPQKRLFPAPSPKHDSCQFEGLCVSFVKIGSFYRPRSFLTRPLNFIWNFSGGRRMGGGELMLQYPKMPMINIPTYCIKLVVSDVKEVKRYHHIRFRISSWKEVKRLQYIK